MQGSLNRDWWMNRKGRRVIYDSENDSKEIKEKTYKWKAPVKVNSSWNNTHKKQRCEVMETFKKKKKNVIVATQVFREGA